MTHKFTFNEIECIAIREALTEYYQTVSKGVLKREDISPIARKMHEAIGQLKNDFKVICCK